VTVNLAIENKPSTGAEEAGTDKYFLAYSIGDIQHTQEPQDSREITIDSVSKLTKYNLRNSD
jgi:hypothetical protein